jgi:Uncharacterized protein conserved in bacteria
LVQLKCDYGTHKEKEDIAHLFDNVEVTKENLSLTCDSITFYSKQNKVESTGNPKVVDLEYNLKSDTLIYFTELDSGIALGQVKLYQNKQKITADRIEYIKKPGSNTVSYNAIGNVIIEDSLRTATCGLAIYNYTTEETQLEIKPKIIDDKRALYGKKIIMRYEQKKLKNIYIPQNAHASTITKGYKRTKDDTTQIELNSEFIAAMTGTSLEGFFGDGILVSLRFGGLATTVFRLFEDSLYTGKYVPSGKALIMNFNEKELLKMIVNGGSQGKDTPDS